jgi:DUF4097 and DUF4098 domain-containing protein YvlB
MLLAVLSLITLTMPVTQQTDTVIPVRAGTRLKVENFNGETVVRTWDKSAIHIVADGDSRSRLDIRNLGSLLTVKSESRYGPPRNVEYEITVPAKTDLDISGVYNNVTIEGVQAGINVETVNGDIDVRGGDGNISLKSVEGDVTLSDAKGRITLSSVNQDVRVENANGDITVDAVNGSVTMERITSASVAATTVNGDVIYDGVIQDGGQYTLNTHNGDVSIGMAPTTNATVEVSTFNGEFETDFPVMLSHTSRNRFSFVLGTGSSRISLESFQGTIRLHRPGEASRGDRGRSEREKQKYKNKHRDQE